MSAALQKAGLPTMWLPDIVELIAGLLPPNETVCTLRLVNKATSEQFRNRNTVKLSLPVPHHAFKDRWRGVSAIRSLTLQRRRQLLCLTAASGCLDNLDVAMEAAGCSLTCEVMEAAAAANQLHACQRLKELGCPWGAALAAAAGAGHMAMCKWLLDKGCTLPAQEQYAVDGLRAGRNDLVECLVQHIGRFTMCQGYGRRLMAAAAYGCDLAGLQRTDLWIGKGQSWISMQSDLLFRWNPDAVLNAAVSPTPDWQAKVEWLERQDDEDDLRSSLVFEWISEKCAAEDAVNRLDWFRQRGYPFAATDALTAAASAGNIGAIQYLIQAIKDKVLSEESSSSNLGWPESSPDLGWPDFEWVSPGEAARRGHLAALEALQAHNLLEFPRQEIQNAASGGHLAVVAWLVETLNINLAQEPQDVFTAAATSGNVELMAWMRERDCPWDATAVTGAAESGCLAALDWLVEAGCPIPDDGKPYLQAVAQGDLAVRRRLHELGCPLVDDVHGTLFVEPAARGDVAILRSLQELVRSWSPTGKTFNRWASRGYPLVSLRWLAEEKGCPADYRVALRCIEQPGPKRVLKAITVPEDVVAWLTARAAEQPPPRPSKSSRELDTE